ncbi:MAG: TetR/AcrR family transcriptional regulator [Oscillospiraceae bacterium]|jgi:AcrR family transcriptional regulator
MNMKDRIIQSAIKCASVHSLTDLRMKHIGAECQTSEANVYRFFNGKDDLLITCFHLVNQEIAALYRGVSTKNLCIDTDLEGCINFLWGKFFHYLLTNPEKAIFYFHFCNSNYYTIELRQFDLEYFKDLHKILQEIDDIYHIFDRVALTIWWTYVRDTTMSFVYRILKQEIPGDEQAQLQIFHLIYGGVQSLLQ